MANQPIPKINYSFAPIDGHNVIREKLASLSDDDWSRLLVRSINEPVIEGVQFPQFPEDELQNRNHGNYGAASVEESANFFRFIKQHTCGTHSNASGKRLLDFGAGWGSAIRSFLSDFEFTNVYGFEPNYLFCALARTLNPYVTFLAGTFVPAGDTPAQLLDFDDRLFNILAPISDLRHIVAD